MNLSADCICCLVAKQQQVIQKYEDENVKSAYLKSVLRMIADADPNASAPRLLADINSLHQAYFGFSYSSCFDTVKKEYNDFVLCREAEITARLDETNDSLLSAVKFARAGNYIDFGAMNNIENEKLTKLLDNAAYEEIDPTEFKSFVHDLQTAEQLVYLTDNCGEIVLDKILIRLIQKQYPRLHITVITRGKPVLNDATMEDAEYIGLSAIVEVIGNGTEIAGTQLDAIDPEARHLIMAADLIIAKGQGNFETLHGCGFNIYYMFLCKCDWFVRRFQLEKYQGVFMNERTCVIALSETKNI